MNIFEILQPNLIDPTYISNLAKLQKSKQEKKITKSVPKPPAKPKGRPPSKPPPKAGSQSIEVVKIVP